MIQHLCYSALMAAMCFLAQPVFCADIDSRFLSRQEEKLFLHGKEYRAIGVNMPNLFQSYVGTWHHNIEIYGSHEKARQAMIAGVADAAGSGFTFIRFFANPGYANDMELLYMKDRNKYWQGMDEVLNLCRKHNLRVVPCLNVAGGAGGFNEYYDEPKQAVFNLESKTRKAVYEFIREFVTRYKDDPVVLMWELENEGMLKADIDRQGQKRNPTTSINRDQKPRPPYVREDSLTFDMIVRLYKEHAAFIKSIDKNHLITSGDAGVRRECASRRETFPNFKYRDDTFREYIANNLLSQPEPLDVFSFHFYGANTDANGQTIKGVRSTEDMRRLCRASMAAGAPVFVGELEVKCAFIKFDPTQIWTQQFIDMAEKEGVSLMALWVWHFPWQPEMTMDSKKNPDLVKRCAAFNKKYADGGDLLLAPK